MSNSPMSLTSGEPRETKETNNIFNNSFGKEDEKLISSSNDESVYSVSSQSKESTFNTDLKHEKPEQNKIEGIFVKNDAFQTSKAAVEEKKVKPPANGERMGNSVHSNSSKETKMLNKSLALDELTDLDELIPAKKVKLGDIRAVKSFRNESMAAEKVQVEIMSFEKFKENIPVKPCKVELRNLSSKLPTNSNARTVKKLHSNIESKAQNDAFEIEMEEDISEEAMILRHERALTEERRKFQTYLKYPWSTQSRANRRIDSLAESSGANTPDPTSPAPNTSTVGGDHEVN